MPSLSRSEARSRARLLEVHSYEVDLDLTGDGQEFGSTTVVRFACAEPGAATFVELKPAALRSAVLNGRPLDPSSAAGGRLRLSGLVAENELRVEADMRYSHTGEGMHRFTDPADGEVYVHTQCGPGEASRVFACFDQPDLKAVFQVRVTAPRHWTVLGNGAGRRRGPGRWEFDPTPPISSYLAVVVGGPLHSVRAEHDGIPLGLHCTRSLAAHLDADADEIFGITRRGLDRYHELFEERYPFGKYDQAFVPELNFGAMENPGCVTFRDDFVFRSAVTAAERETRAIVILHEMAHMWFGDLVTMRWWDDLWLNESFAEYMGHWVAVDAGPFPDAWTGFAVTRKPWGYDADQRPSSHPVAAQGIDDTAAALANFDGISYAKGASALRQLVAWVGERAFLAGVNDHFARHRFGNADLADLLGALTRSSGRDVHGWAERWLRTSGVDTLRVETAEAADRPGTLSSASVVNLGAPGGAGPVRPHRVLVGAYDLVAGEGRGPRRLVPRDRLVADLPAAPGGDGTVRVPLAPLAHALRPDLLLVNDGDLGYVKVRLDPRSWRAVTEGLSTLEDGLSRALLWNTARDLVRDGELPATDFLALAAAHLAAEPVVAVVEAVLDFGRRHVADRYLPPAERPAALATLAGVCAELLRRTARAGDPGLRLAAVRGLIRCASTPDELGALREWMRVERVPDGPDLDPELRWPALLQLVALGAAGEAQIAAELARDPGATGRQGAARCRAALPDPEAKERAWRVLFGDGAFSRQELIATAQGFWQPARPEPTAGFVERYFAEVPATGERGPAMARVFGGELFPVHAATPGTVRAADLCLHRTDLTPALRRVLADQSDDLRRAARIRALPREA